MTDYDVIIVGGGPAGLNCAQTLSNSKKKVLLLEKNPEIGPKVCAGGLTRESIDYLNLPNDFIESMNEHTYMHTPFQAAKLNCPVWTIDRKRLGQWQLAKLKKTSVKVNSRVTSISASTVTVNESKKYKYKYLVGADGSNSIVRRYLGIKTNKLGIAVQYLLKSNKYKKCEFFYDTKLFNSWYAWIFPQGETVSIGCGCDPKHFSLQKMLVNFHSWLDKNNIDVSNAKYEASSINYDFQGYKFGRIFLIGDAAGLASGLTGEGIYQALVSGEEIAKIILNKTESSGLKKIIKTNKFHTKILELITKSGPLRRFELEFTILLMRLGIIQI